MRSLCEEGAINTTEELLLLLNGIGKSKDEQDKDFEKGKIEFC